MTAPARPIGATEFTRAMRALGPFERHPEIAVAVSGGADSLALALLADEWARGLGGRSLALTVDHGLRAEAAGEARQVKRWLAARGIAHVTLVWRGPKPRSGLQAAARRARYALMARRCRARGVLHLLLAHQAEDQAETFLIRLAHGSGLDGLAAMPAVAEFEGVRLLRPLLPVPRARLRATLAARGQEWIEDPSNLDPAFERVRLRNALPRLKSAGIDVPAATATAQALGRARARFDDPVAALLVRVRLEPEGWARLPRAWLAQAPRALALKALTRLLLALGGHDYPPRGERLEALLDWMLEGAGRGRTLAGCRLQRSRDGLLVFPEQADRVASRRAARPGLWIGTAGRVVTLTGRARRGWQIGPLGEAGVAALAAASGRPSRFRSRSVPGPVAAGLPALRDGRGRLIEVPDLGLSRPKAATGPRIARIRWRPRRPLVPGRFAVV